jgi:PD-(D/E)XK nuclease superfamily protein
MQRDTSIAGDRAELEVAAALVAAGRRLLKPMSSAARYDLAIDKGDGSVVRVQCKTGVLKGGRIIFRVCSTDARRRRGVPYHGQIDAFGVFCPQTSISYLVPMGAVANCRTMSALRVSAAANNQRRGVRMAVAFEIRPKRAQVVSRRSTS